MNIVAIVGITIMLIVILVVFVIIILFFNNNNKGTKGFKKTKGKVVAFNEVFHSHSFKRLYYPIVVYKVNDKEYEITSQIGYGKSIFMPKRIKVLYNPNNPYDAQTADKNIFSIIIVLFFFISILMFMDFFINDIILMKNKENKKEDNVYSYRVACNVSGYIYDEII